MNKQLTIIISDLQNTRRDPTLLLMLCVLIIMIAFLQFAVPALEKFVPLIKEYHFIIISFFVVMNSLFPSFIIAFLLLDEKDLMLVPVYKTTPLSFSGLIFSRMIFIVIVGFFTSWLIVLFNGLIEFDLARGIQFSWLSALHAPIICLLISSLAKNKVEGLTFLKAANLTLFFPLAIFFIDSNWEYLLAIFPAFWSYWLADASDNFALITLIGTVVLLFYNFMAYRFTIRHS